jgi:hypothetical protein
MAGEACCDSISLDGLPGPALQLVDQFVGRDWPLGRTPLLRTSRVLRDTVLAGSKSIRLALQNETPANMAAHRRLLRRACAAASPGLTLAVAATHSRSSTGGHLLHSLLEPLKEEGLPSVHALVLQVYRLAWRAVVVDCQPKLWYATSYAARQVCKFLFLTSVSVCCCVFLSVDLEGITSTGYTSLHCPSHLPEPHSAAPGQVHH